MDRNKIEQAEGRAQQMTAKTKETRKYLRACFWNINGIRGLYNLDTEQIKFLREMEIICLSETWLLDEKLTPPVFLSDYNVILSPANKEKSLGRPSGGLAVLYKSEMNVTQIEITNLWIICHYKQKKASYVIMYHYWKPTEDIAFCIEMLSETLYTKLEQYSQSKWIIATLYTKLEAILMRF
ncbi:hypothetical protein QE152_g23116 [Popillia japonica]|uniref:Endonuclease/exonuclease/phosphatase domain-containing protein n=1 Tax=Popillia japonica TaxID=7064 RepID=A0AAW1KIS6_POPJA